MNHNRDLTPTRFVEAAVIKHDVFIYDEIGGPEHYVDLIHSLNTASENEVFYLNIATGGGDLDGCIAIINALRNTAAHTIGVADSVVASAGTIIFLACKELHIKEFAYFMFHDGGGVTAGKFNENLKQISSISKLYRKIAERIYKPFFTDEEITKIMDGSDLYQDAEEMQARIEAAFAQMDAEEEAAELEAARGVQDSEEAKELLDQEAELINPELLLEESAIDRAIATEQKADTGDFWNSKLRPKTTVRLDDDLPDHDYFQSPQ